MIARALLAILLAATLRCCPLYTTDGPVVTPRRDVEIIDGVHVVPNRAIVKVKGDPRKFLQSQSVSDLLPEASLESLVVRSLRIHAYIADIGTVVIRSTTLSATQLIQFLRGFPDMFEYVEPECVFTPMARPREQFFRCRLWGLKKIGSRQAWDCTVGSDQIVVAVLDEGIDTRHSDLIGNVWKARKDINVEVDGKSVPCKEGAPGYDAVKDQCRSPLSRHGTHVAGTIAAVEDDDGVVGVAWRTKVLSVRVLGSEEETPILKGLEFVRNLKANYPDVADVRVVNMSFGSPCSSKALHESLKATAAKDIVLVAAAGNDGTNNDDPETPYYPSNFIDVETLIAVAASTRKDHLADFSNFGKRRVHLMAPGDNILSTVEGGFHHMEDGTSMAAAHVSGAAALIAAACPNATALEIKRRILDSVDPVDAVKARLFTGGRLNVANAVKGCVCEGATPAAE